MIQKNPSIWNLLLAFLSNMTFTVMSHISKIQIFCLMRLASVLWMCVTIKIYNDWSINYESWSYPEQPFVLIGPKQNNDLLSSHNKSQTARYDADDEQ